MKVADLPPEVINDLCQDDKWRLDIDPGFDCKHEFWMVWRHFIALRQANSYYQPEENDLAEFYSLDGFEVLFPVPRTHHPSINIIRLIPSADGQSLTILLHDSYHENWFTREGDARSLSVLWKAKVNYAKCGLLRL